LSAATREVSAVTRLDGKPVGSGKRGPVWTRLRAAFDALKARVAREPW